MLTEDLLSTRCMLSILYLSLLSAQSSLMWSVVLAPHFMDDIIEAGMVSYR